jgi:hypothetical protein
VLKGDVVWFVGDVASPCLVLFGPYCIVVTGVTSSSLF